MILLDTNVLSELTKPQPASQVVDWLAENEPRLSLPTIALAELRYGIERLPEGRRRLSLLRFWEETRRRFAGRTFGFDVLAAERYGCAVAAAERAGRSVRVGDGQIAAIALSQRMTVATRDVEDFRPTGVRLINPWDLG
ncbi:MAG: type II toxin-antitoxin system VapC family toxin [Thiohalocapsa sp.]